MEAAVTTVQYRNMGSKQQTVPLQFSMRATDLASLLQKEVDAKTSIPALKTVVSLGSKSMLCSGSMFLTGSFEVKEHMHGRDWNHGTFAPSRFASTKFVACTNCKTLQSLDCPNTVWAVTR